jgi:cell division septum initiation protein DivIVA
LIDQLDELLKAGWEIPMSSQRVVPAREIEQLIERMRITVPSSIRDSERTLADRDKILAEAKQEAERILQQARQQAAEMLSERALVATAQQEAMRIVEDSRETARRRAEEADLYSMQVLQGLAQQLRATLQQVDNGIRLMQEGLPRPEGSRPSADAPAKKPRPRQPSQNPPQNPPQQPNG